ncbi:Gliding motility protein OS=Streptomyces tendae OX=1932 GN=GUR47_34660 PE=4 SV=1 [Streptomyces tendae]
MGVFARLFRRSQSTEEASGEQARADTPGSEGAAEVKATEAAETADAGPRNTAEAGGAAAEADDSEGVGIPKQQSAGEAVDNEADKGART